MSHVSIVSKEIVGEPGFRQVSSAQFFMRTETNEMVVAGLGNEAMLVKASAAVHLGSVEAIEAAQIAPHKVTTYFNCLAQRSAGPFDGIADSQVPGMVTFRPIDYLGHVQLVDCASIHLAFTRRTVEFLVPQYDAQHVLSIVAPLRRVVGHVTRQFLDLEARIGTKPALDAFTARLTSNTLARNLELAKTG